MVHETVSLNRTLLYFLKLVCNFSRLLSPVHTMKLLSATQCCRQKFHGVYVRETCFKRFFMVHETVSSNRTLLYFLKLVCNFSRLLANHSSAISEGQFTCNSCKCVYTIKKGVFKSFSSSLSTHFEVPLTKPHIFFFIESNFMSSNFVLFAVHLNVALQVQ